MKISRTDAIKRGVHAEVITSLAFKCKIERSTGYDLRTKNGAKVEVRSRVKFSDGKNPRLTVNKSKMEESDVIVAVQYERNLDISKAIAIKTKYLTPLYAKHLQKDGSKAHLNWKKVSSHPKTHDVTIKLMAADNALKLKGFFL
ncbi:hypothetical protein Q9L42_005480 [Methylomarinum sp. Ch1-1]|uniref:Uncharacterized protein n=1 Tax=Methylomarinum roseum TaxID=3067653 RepID=A0AAU7NX94_9GAMM|nr:hypothetical protein [Methylomarinum sp. Ch1-1]MDP4522349.1 hypothetical protein [Methylomarinum sp. Ch1-1]